MMSRPLVTVVVPSFNKGRFVRECVESVLNQTYSHIELLVYDACSTDGSPEILKEYAGRLTLVVEPDRGQCDAINKGFRAARGAILTWLCADDLFFPDAVERAVAHFEAAPETRLIYGRGWHVDAEGNRIRTIGNREHRHRLLVNVDYILQPATFFRREVFDRVGEIDESLEWGLDWDYWIRASKHYPLRRVDDLFGKFRLTPDIKTLSGGVPRLGELARICRRHGGLLQPSHVVLGAMYAVGKVASLFGRDAPERSRQFLKRMFKPFYGPWAMYG